MRCSWKRSDLSLSRRRKPTAPEERSKLSSYLITLLEVSAEEILETFRQHWQIENGLLGSGRPPRKSTQVRTQNAAEHPTLLRRLVFSTVKLDEQGDAGTKNKRMRAGWDDEYREHLLHIFKMKSPCPPTLSDCMWPFL